MSKLPNPYQVCERLKNLSTKSKYDAPKYDLQCIHDKAMIDFKRINLTVTAKAQFDELINPYLQNNRVKHLNMGWSSRYKSITFSLLNGNEIKTLIVRSATHNDVSVKWKSYGIKSFIPTRINQDDEVIFVSSGIGEYLLLEAFEVSYIALQSDHNDRHITQLMIEATHGKIIVYFQDNDDSAKQLGERLKVIFCGALFITINFETVRDHELPKGYDLRDFCNEIAKEYGERAREVIYQMINKEIKEGGMNAVCTNR